MLHPTDTIAYNAEKVARWQSDPAYNYNRELMMPDVNIYELLLRWLNELLGKFFGSKFANDYGELVLVLIFVAIVLLLVWFLYRKRPELFMRSRKVPLQYTVHEDTIYGIDFNKEIERALSGSDYKEAVRLLYLQTLKQLSDKELIDWQLYKTPTEYIYEVKAEGMKESFRNLTNSFLRVRYGNFEASELLFQEMRQQQEKMFKGGNG
ncbi:DUF4129 domain-containing protein [Bacteroides sp. 224]|uniref:DUF4129 domain-containing protein n=1 Tax=Bacteroides sp. 224 TaxID=2302936 RepID=UPI0013D4789E|nr:DUF4129 domain-containing protein [Bacteroides sp. 224]NDV66451.1 DUF4129 domain-containing protein [Bacteroides sp. 224]